MAPLSFRTALTIRVTVVILLTMSIVGVFTYFQVSNTAREQSDRVLGQTSALVDGQITGLLSKAKDQAELLSIVNLPRRGQPVDMDAAARSMVDLIQVNDEIGSLSIVLDRDGRYVRVSRGSKGVLEIQQATFGERAKRVTAQYRLLNQTIEQFKEEDGWPTDARLEKTYIETKESRRLTWSESSLEVAPGDRSIPGLTVGTQLTDPTGQFLGVVRATLNVTDLSNFVKGIGVGDKGFACILGAAQLGSPRVVAYPDAGRIVVQDNDRLRLATIKEIDQPTIASLLTTLGSEPADPKIVTRYTFFSNRVTYVAAVRYLSDQRLPRLAVAVVVPYEEFTTGTRKTIAFFATFILLALGVGVLVSMVIARRISRPLVRLAEEARQIQSLHLEPATHRVTRIREIDELATSMENMKTGLRSLEKLVPAEYARWLISSGQEAKLGGERRHLTTYFGDIIGFTSLSHDLAPEELMKVLTEYLDLLSIEVLAHGGTIDKFNGDDVMAFWGAPTMTEDHALAACRSSLASVRAVQSMHLEWSDHGRPMLGASFGISTGDVIVGNVGNRQRMNYTVIGDSVNMASRLQGLNKFFGTLILISSSTKEEAGPDVVTRWVDRVRVSGRDEAEDVYELLSMREDSTTHERDFERLHDEARTAFLAQDWITAENLMAQVMAIDPHDGPSSILRSRIQELRSRPPGPGWDGSHPIPGK